MECNKDEAERAKGISESMLLKGDIAGARKFALKAKQLYPELHGLTQLLCTVDVHFAVHNKLQYGENNWYAVLQVSPDADESTIRKQYRKLALLLHPDKNKAFGAEAAFKCLSEGWSFLSDKVKKAAYDARHKIALNKMTAGSKPPQKTEKKTPVNPNSFQSQNRVQSYRNSGVPVECRQQQAENKLPDMKTFWTQCPSCKMQLEYERIHINKNLCCPMCCTAFLSKEITPFTGPVVWPPPGMQDAKMVHERNGFFDGIPKTFHNTNVNVLLETRKSKVYSKLANGEVHNQRGHGHVQSVESEEIKGKGPVNRFAHSGLNRAEDKFQPVGNSVDLQSSRMTHEEIKIKIAEAFAHCNDKDQGSMQGGHTGKSRIAKAETVSQPGRKPSVVKTNRKRIIKELTAKDVAHAKKSFDRLLGRTKYGENPSAAKERIPLDQFSGKSPTFDDKNGSLSKAGKSDKSVCDEIPMSDAGSQPVQTSADKVSARSCSLGVHCKDSDGYPQDSLESLKPKSSKQKRSMTSANVDAIEKVSCTKKLKLDEVRNGEEQTLLYAGVSMEVPDADFYDFDGDRKEGDISAGQVWALYDDDGMPRYYAQVNKVLSTKPFKVQMAWLEAWQPSSEYAAGSSYTCGNFKLGRAYTTDCLNLFSHQMKTDKLSRGVYNIYPRSGEVWAMHKKKDALEAGEMLNYDMVEILDGYADEIGVRVSLLSKIEGFKTLFALKSGEEHVNLIPCQDLKMFSHYIPAQQHKAGKIPGILGDCWELDPASTPMYLISGN